MYDKTIKVRKGALRGYDYFIDKDHPLASGNSGYVYVHRHLASLKLGRWLDHNENVHHLDGDRQNNDLDNLVVLTRSEHAKKHRPKKPTIICRWCGRKAKTRDSKIYCSRKCVQFAQRRAKRPTKKMLKKEIETLSWKAMGRKYGVSDNAVRKWARSYDLI